MRKGFNKVRTLQSPEGEWISDLNTLERMVQDFYIKVFQGESVNTEGNIPQTSCLLSLLANQYLKFSQQIMMEKLKAAIFDMVPGPDGFHVGFY